MEGFDEKVYDKAIQLLNMRQHTTGELLDKLKKRGYKQSEAAPVIRRLEELRFLDDQRFAEIFVENLKRYKSFGFYGIKAKLLQKKVPTDIIESALSDFFTEEDELKVARRFAQKQKRLKKDMTYEKLATALARKGFRAAVISKACHPGFG